MMIRRDLHTHTTFSDGKNTPEEMVLAAISAGLEEYGISDHAYTSFDDSCCMPWDRYGEYLKEIFRLKEKYRDRIRVLCGIEQDFYSVPAPEELDYVIGSVHYIELNGEYIPIDWNGGILKRLTEEHFGGDPYAMCRRYFETVAQVVERTHADIIGHFDVIAKFNQREPLFDEQDERYRSAWQSAMLALIPYGKPFEINHGAQNHGLRSVPFLTEEMQAFLIRHGGKTLHSSDSHNVERIALFPK